MSDVDKWEADQLLRATSFCATAFRGRGIYEQRGAATLGGAIEQALTLGRAMIYAITPEGWSIHVCNVDVTRRARIQGSRLADAVVRAAEGRAF